MLRAIPCACLLLIGLTSTESLSAVEYTVTENDDEIRIVTPARAPTP